MADSNDPRDARDQSSPLSVLNGIWFRRERERIAIGRPVIAAHLGVPTGRVAELENKNMAVPNQWWPLLPALGFEHPSLLLFTPKGGTVDATAEPSPPAVSPAMPLTERVDTVQTYSRAPTFPDSVQSLPAQSATEQGEQDAAPTGPVKQPDAVGAAQVLTLPTTATPVSARPQARLPPAPDIPRGLWLRSRRLELGHSLQAMSKALGISAHDLGVFEWQNLLVPPSWMLILEAFRFCRWAPSPAGQGSVESQPTGAWLRLERQRKGITIEVCAINLGLRTHLLEMVELQDWPLTPEWLPALSQLGFVGPSITPSQIVPNAAAEAVPRPPLGTEPVLPSAEENRSLGAHTGQIVPAPLTDTAALHVQRPEEELSRVPGTENLKVSAQTSGSHEPDDQPVSADRLPLVRPLGNLAPPTRIDAVPADPVSPSVPSAAAAAKAAPPPRTPNPSLGTKRKNGSGDLKKQTEPEPLTGAWLRIHRYKRKLGQKQLAKKLKITTGTLGRYERADKPVRPEWLPSLRRLGFPVPLPSADGAASPPAPVASVASAHDRRLSGSWLHAECQRLGLNELALQKALGGVELGSLRNRKGRSGHVPDSWLSTLSALGFRLPSHLANWNPAQVAGTPQPRGAWLLKARQRLKVPMAQVRRAVGVHQLTIKAMERHNRLLPAEWLPALSQLGLRVPGEKAAPPAQRNKSEGPKNQEPIPKGRPPASEAVELEASSLPAPLLPEQRKELVATIIKYRLKLGRSTGKPAFQVLGWITQDMQEVGLEDFVTYEVLHAALQAIK